MGGAITPALGPGLLLRALAAGLVGSLTSVPRTIAAGIAIGVIEAVLFASYPADLGLVDVVLFVAILLMLLARSRTDAGADESLTFGRSEEHTSELQSLMRISYAVFCLKKKKQMYTAVTTKKQT